MAIRLVQWWKPYSRILAHQLAQRQPHANDWIAQQVQTQGLALKDSIRFTAQLQDTGDDDEQEDDDWNVAVSTGSSAVPVMALQTYLFYLDKESPLGKHQTQQALVLRQQQKQERQRTQRMLAKQQEQQKQQASVKSAAGDTPTNQSLAAGTPTTSSSTTNGRHQGTEEEESLSGNSFADTLTGIVGRCHLVRCVYFQYLVSTLSNGVVGRVHGPSSHFDSWLGQGFTPSFDGPLPLASRIINVLSLTQMGNEPTGRVGRKHVDWRSVSTWSRSTKWSQTQERVVGWNGEVDAAHKKKDVPVECLSSTGRDSTTRTLRKRRRQGIRMVVVLMTWTIPTRTGRTRIGCL